jgi:hypothetical protein
VLSIVQIFLAIGGWAGGLHPLGRLARLALMGLAGWMAHDAWRGRASATVSPSA